jgi:hypothetical protein
MPSRDILFPLPISGRKPADCGHSWQIVRTMRSGWRGHFGPFPVSLGPLSPTQPNHAQFGTDIRSSTEQWVTETRRGAGSKGARSGGVNSERTVRFGTDLESGRAAFYETGPPEAAESHAFRRPPNAAAVMAPITGSETPRCTRTGPSGSFAAPVHQRPRTSPFACSDEGHSSKADGEVLLVTSGLGKPSVPMPAPPSPRARSQRERWIRTPSPVRQPL